jgi:hypothetical protein
LATAQLLNTLLLVMLTVEADTNANADVIFYACAALFIVRLNLIVSVEGSVGLSLNDQAATARGNKLFKDIGKLAGYLFECAFNGFILPLV